MSDPPITTTELIERYVDETGATTQQALLIVARAGLIRHLATNPLTAERFILKGGSLLHHVYNLPRVSYRDADLADISQEPLAVPEIKRLLTFEAGGLRVAADEGIWAPLDDLFKGTRVPFTVRAVGKRDPNGLTITISIRKTERLDDCGKVLFSCSLLSGTQRFPVHGLSLDELSAEKFLGWTSKRLPKHYADLGLIARDRAAAIHHEHVADLIARKFAAEKGHEGYVRQGIHDTHSLADAFRRGPALASASKTWSRQLAVELFVGDEGARSGSIVDFEVTDALVRDFWQPVVDALRQRRRPR